MAAYDALPDELRRVVAASPWPLPCDALAQVLVARGFKAAERRLRDWEQQFAADHERVTAEACEQ